MPDSAVPYLGLVPLVLGLRAAWTLWRDRHQDAEERPDDAALGGPTTLAVATVTFANGGDNIGVYVPVFATAGGSGLSVYAVVFLALVGVWAAAGKFFATRARVAKALSRCGHVLLPVVLVGIGVVILVEGGAFGL